MEKDAALKKILHYCAYQDRSFFEVETKLKSFEITDEERKSIIETLVNESFIDDGRFARSFVRSKIDLKKWGANKIRLALKAKGIADDIIMDALSEIDEELYVESLRKILSSKKINENDPLKRKAKLAAYGIQKGYPPEMVWQVVRTM